MGVIRKDASVPDSTTEATDDKQGFESLIVLQFREDVAAATVEWLLGKIQASRYSGGAELLARTVLNEKGQVKIWCYHSNRIVVTSRKVKFLPW